MASWRDGNRTRVLTASGYEDSEMRPRETSAVTDETPRLPAKPDPGWSATWQGKTRQTRQSQEPPARAGEEKHAEPRMSALGALPALWQRLWAARWRLAIWCASVALATLATHLFSGSAVARHVSAFLYTFNFDQERVLLMTTLLMLVAGSATAGGVFRWRWPAALGSLLYFTIWYLLPFVARVQHPPLGPAGLKQELIPGALTNMVVTLLGVALVCASVGAAIGAAYGELVVTPLVMLARRLWDWARQPAGGGAKPLLRALPRSAVSLALGGLLVYAVVLTSFVPGTLLTFGIEGTLYRLAPGAHVGNEQAHGTVLQGTYKSEALGGATRTYFIYLPPSYVVAQVQRYPVLYMLHGSPGTPHNWVGAGKGPVTEDALVATGLMRETIIVTGDGTGPIYGFSEWANSFDGRQRMEDAVATDLVHYIDQHYRTLADAADRAIGGNSEGGFGAVNIALHHPDIFGAALSMGGYFTAEGPVFGYGHGSALYRAYNSPSAYIFTSSGARAVHALRFVICVASQDGVYYTDGITFSQQLRRVGAHVTLLKDTGGHSWALWALELGKSLPLLEPPLLTAGTHP